MSDIQEIILEELRALRSDIVPRINKVEQWQANANGKITMFGLFCAGIGGVVSWISAIMHRSG